MEDPNIKKEIAAIWGFILSLCVVMYSCYFPSDDSPRKYKGKDFEEWSTMLESEEPDERIQAVWAIGRFEGEESYSKLIETLEDEEISVQESAVLQIGLMATRYDDEVWPKKAVPSLTDMLEDCEEKKLRRFITNTLWRITGQNYGSDTDKWRKWYSENKDDKK